MTRKKFIDAIGRVFWLVVFVAMFGNSYAQHRKLNPTATFGDFLVDTAPIVGGVIAILAGLGLVLWFEQRMLLAELKKRAGAPPPEGLGGLLQVYPLRMVITGGFIAATAVLVWVQSWVAVPVLAAALLAAVHVARLAGLEPTDDPAAPQICRGSEGGLKG